MRASQLIQEIKTLFRDQGLEEPDREADLLVSYLLDKRIPEIMAHDPEVSEEVREKAVEIAVQRYTSRAPLAYIIGKWHFFGHTLFVSRDVLVPRPETENLVELLLSENSEPDLTLLDVGTGSGNIALTIASQRPEWQITALDFSRKAVRNAEQNRVLLGLENVAVRCCGIQFYDPDIQFDVIVSNPPYIAADDLSGLSPEVRSEPETSLTDGGDGLGIYRIIRDFAGNHLAEKGKIYLEIAPELEAELREIFSKIGDLQFVNDYRGNLRILRVSCH